MTIQVINSPITAIAKTEQFMDNNNGLSQKHASIYDLPGDVLPSQIVEGDFAYSFLKHDQDLDGSQDTIELRTALAYQYTGIREFFYLNMLVSMRYWNTTTLSWDQTDEYGGSIGTSIMYTTDQFSNIYNGSYFFPLPLEGDYQLNITGAIDTLDLIDSSIIWTTMDAFDLGNIISDTKDDWDADTFSDTIIMDLEFAYNQTETVLKEILDLRLQMIVEFWNSTTSSNTHLEIINSEFDLIRSPNNIYAFQVTWNAPFDGNFTFKLTLSDSTSESSSFEMWNGEFIWVDAKEYAPDYDLWFSDLMTYQTKDADFDGLVDTTKVSFSGGVDGATYSGSLVTFQFLLRIYEWNALTSQWSFLEFNDDTRVILINDTNSYPQIDFLYRAPADAYYKFEMTVFVDSNVAFVNFVTWVSESEFKGMFYDWEYRTNWFDDDGDSFIDSFNVKMSVRIEKLGLIEFIVHVDVYVANLRDVVIESWTNQVSITVDTPGWFNHEETWVSSLEINGYYLHVYLSDLQGNIFLDLDEDSEGNNDIDWQDFEVHPHSSTVSSSTSTTSDQGISTTDPTTPIGSSSDEASTPIAGFLLVMVSLLSFVFIKVQLKRRYSYNNYECS